MANNDAQTILVKYLSDMISLEQHISQAIDKQVKELTDVPNLSSKLSAFQNTLSSHRDALNDRVTALGGAANHPVKEGVAGVFGVAAGVIDKFRSDEESKDLRDDYTAINLSLVAYLMLHTTALAVSDQQTAALAKRFMKDNAGFVVELQHMIPEVTVANLKQNYNAPINDQAVSQALETIKEVWGENKGSSQKSQSFVSDGGASASASV